MKKNVLGRKGEHSERVTAHVNLCRGRSITINHRGSVVRMDSFGFLRGGERGSGHRSIRFGGCVRRLSYGRVLISLFGDGGGVQEVCKLLRHVAPVEALQVAAKYAEITVRIYGPQMLTACHTLSLYPTSKIAKENLQGEPSAPTHSALLKSEISP